MSKHSVCQETVTANDPEARGRHRSVSVSNLEEPGSARPTVIPFEQLGSGSVRTFRGGEYGGVPVSFILDGSAPGGGPALHRHPYDELWVLFDGQVTFTADGETVVAGSNAVVRVPAGTAHTFRNTGDRPVQMICIHPRERMETEWLEARQ